ncbi:MAG TPA: hypothetical protein VF493_10555 [Terriglobales bacterium]
MARKRIHLVSRGDQHNKFTTEPLVGSGLRIRLAENYADIVCNHTSDPEIWHWVVQRDGSTDILKWGQERDRGAAEQAAKNYLESLAAPYKPHLVKGSGF